MSTTTITEHLAEVRRLLDLADRMRDVDGRLIGSLMIAISTLADAVEQLNKRISDAERVQQENAE